ncbi:hypothetical protein QJQ45_026791 [Haematococcus lacustris]|nr:hypothetical protein QJQ45_026791 [Haematococcus lacustris]
MSACQPCLSITGKPQIAIAVAAAPHPTRTRAAKARQEVCGYGINAHSSELKAATLDKGHVADLIEEANTHRRLLGMRREGQGHGQEAQLGLTKETREAFNSEPALSHHWARWFNTNKLRNKEFAFERAVAEMREFVFDPDTQIGVGIDPGVTQAVSAASGVWDLQSGQLMADQLRRWKLTKGQVKHDSGLNNARRDTERWLAPIKPHLQHLAAASSAGTSLEANQKHITVTLATWDAVWEVYLDPKWARQRLRLYGAQDRALEQFFNKLEEEMAELSMKRHNHAKQLVLFFGAATIGTGGGWGADAVLRACRKVVCRPRGPDQLRGRVVLVDEHRTSRVSSAVNGQQPCEEELDKLSATRPAGWKPPAGQVEQRLVRPAWSQERGQPVRGLMWCPVVPPRKPPQAPRSSQAATQPAASEPGPSTPPPAKRSKPAAEPTKGKGKGKAAKAKPVPQPGRWLDWDCNAALNMQRVGESRWRPLELCYWPDQGALPAKGKEYPGLGYKRLAQNNFFSDPAFVAYLDYLKYWQQPSYAKYIQYPHCLFFLTLLQNPDFCKELSRSTAAVRVTQQTPGLACMRSSSTPSSSASGSTVEHSDGMRLRSMHGPYHDRAHAQTMTSCLPAKERQGG